MNKYHSTKKLQIHLAILHGLFVLQWFWLMRHEYLLNVCRTDLERSASIFRIWGELTPISKFLTIVVIFITFHAIITGIKKLTAVRKNRD